MDQLGALLDHLLKQHQDAIEALREEVAELRQEIRRRERQPPPAPTRSVLRIRDVCHRSGLSRATIYRLEQQGQWPRRFRLSDGRVGWDEAEIEAQIRDLQERRIGSAK